MHLPFLRFFSVEFFKQLQFVQKISLIFFSFYICFLLIVSIRYNEEPEAESIIGDTVADFQDSKGVYMENIDRIEYKNNIKKWTLKASIASYAESTGQASFEKPTIFVFNEKTLKPTMITSLRAQVATKEGNVNSAILTGDVRLKDASGVVVESEVAEYFAEESKVIFPQKAVILGKGYRVEGNRLIVSTVDGILDFYTNVSSTFDSTANLKAFSDMKKISE